MKIVRVIGLTLLAGCLTACSISTENTIVIGSKNFTEQVILTELLAQHIENRTGLTVIRKANLGGTFICHTALLAGDIDLYVEYTGTALTAILKQEPTGDPEEVYRRVKQAYAEQFQADWLSPLGFNDTFAIIVRQKDAEELGLKTISDIAPLAPEWQPGFSYEFAERPDGFKGMVETYGLKFTKIPKTMEIGLLYRAVRDGQVDIIAGNSTDGVIGPLGLVILEDDKHYFPPYYAVPVVRQATLAKYPELQAVLEELAGKINEDEMRRMNLAHDAEGADLKELAREFLASKGLTQEILRAAPSE